MPLTARTGTGAVSIVAGSSDRPAVDLEREDPLELALGGLVVDRLRGELAVDLVDQVVAPCLDRVLVPVGHVDDHRGPLLRDPAVAPLVDDDRLAVLRDDAAAPL